MKRLHIGMMEAEAEAEGDGWLKEKWLQKHRIQQDGELLWEFNDDFLSIV